MGGYQISYEDFEVYVQNQALMAKREREKAKEKYATPRKVALYIGSAEGREEAVFEFAKYLGAPENEVKKIWEEASA